MEEELNAQDKLVQDAMMTEVKDELSETTLDAKQESDDLAIKEEDE